MEGEGQPASETPPPAPDVDEARPEGLRGPRAASQRRKDKFSQCIYLDRSVHGSAVAYAKALKDAGQKPDTFSGLVVEALKEYMGSHPTPPPPADAPAPEPASEPTPDGSDLPEPPAPPPEPLG